MSAALVIDTRPLLDEDDGSAAGPSHGPRLHLVPTGAEVLVVVRPVRITRLGRALRAVAALVISVALVSAVVTAVRAAAAVPPRAVTVTSGQTLSEIAARELPGVPVRDGVAAIQLANGLSVSDIHAGQVLTIPAAG